MNSEAFEKILDEQISRCTNVLKGKAKEYATDDRLHNFKVAAALQKTTNRNALAGMMSKHTVSVYDMCRSPEYNKIEMWDEKITDSINYLLLLRAVVEEELDEKVDKNASAAYCDDPVVLVEDCQ